MVEIKIKSNSPKDEHFKFYKYVIFAILGIIALYLIVTLVRVNSSCEEGIDYECPVCEVCETCEVCQEDVVYRNVTREIKVYVCEDGTTQDTLEGCVPPVVVLPPLDPILTNEEGTQIEEIKVNPACVSGYLGGYISYEVTSPAENVRFLIMEENSGYETIINEKGYFNVYKEFLICDQKCANVKRDFTLVPGKRYLLKIEFDRTTLYGKIEYSNEYIIDLTDESNFMTKGC